jgi:hypothetical protein
MGFYYGDMNFLVIITSVGLWSMLDVPPLGVDELLLEIWADHGDEILDSLVENDPAFSEHKRRVRFWKLLASFDLDGLTKWIRRVRWPSVDPALVLEWLAQGMVNVDEIRLNEDPGFSLQDFLIAYLHEFLNCSNQMGLWSLVAQSIFSGAIVGEVALLKFSEAVREIWCRQFPIGSFEKWLNRGLEMLTQDLAQAGIDVDEYMELETMVNSNMQSTPGVGTTASDGSALWFTFRKNTGGWTFYWDPCVEELSSEFWATIENCEQSIPGSWVNDDDPNGSKIGICLLEGSVNSWYCFERRLRPGFDSGGTNEVLRVRGTMTCKENHPIELSSGLIV